MENTASLVRIQAALQKLSNLPADRPDVESLNDEVRLFVNHCCGRLDTIVSAQALQECQVSSVQQALEARGKERTTALKRHQIDPSACTVSLNVIEFTREGCVIDVCVHVINKLRTPMEQPNQDDVRDMLTVAVATPSSSSHALKTGLAPSQVVYDSPAKTMRELRLALNRNVGLLNVDNFDELTRIQSLVSGECSASTSSVGLRINPQIGAGDIEATSTATATAKFGIPVNQPGVLQRVIDSCAAMPRVNALHVHVGSGGMGFDQLVAGVASICSTAEAINSALGHRQITTLDIGGGFPVSYEKMKESPSFAQYWGAVVAAVPSVTEYRLVTEFGRALIARSGYLASKVEYVKSQGGRQIATIHFGADMCVWTAYTKEHMMRLPMDIYGQKDGEWVLRTPEDTPVDTSSVANGLDVVGPLCFSADIVAWEREYLPALREGDVAIFGCTGAYTLSVWSRFNSRPVPKVLVLGQQGERVVKSKETEEEALRIWG
ncbi:ornithine/DAP/Arg decarboxylase [Kipferlia bialata]|uniref:Ornithine/DAP/Arg decarboxylase n=1 Tax=Kipferlia bialata TaxID=797122 RepID=A0A9K3CYC8_9EUKA|nr:ornithine/DAP/Arg decarboxylase [Kipferlia bialata]|eukprot:g6098.t1